MILEAFSEVLHEERRRTGGSAEAILHQWLFSILSEAQPKDNIAKVIHTELELVHSKGSISFVPRSATGETLLKSMYLYCESYENWQFSRWLHELKPHNFNQLPG